MSIIKINQLNKIYNPDTIPVKAVNEVSIEFKQGEFTAIVGPSGSGKTTMLNLIGGLDNPTSGQILIDGKDISKLSASELIAFRRDHIGFVFQDYSLLPVLTAKENVEFIMQLQGRSKKECEERATSLLASVGLADQLHKRPTKLSGGQQQRVAVARALASKPKFVLADEPTANLDSKSTADLLDIMERLNQGEHTTFIFSTHDQRVIDKAHRVIVFEDGQIKDDIRREVSSEK
ncbi:ABC transporter ATP-binding protein [Sediminitomix flava]|uniref:Putative ABC transport system ATP-binding protein n=1 Tax=Sediminitomix flava TaxID=379075 RepID=A0A315ZHB5_SEDFL|nr:ABC transporter ATP-binding protein [Sediminitomix flava]PWJ44583.1 putative ABC transport system ATP-binding protein [Sediminitomix flava]